MGIPSILEIGRQGLVAHRQMLQSTANNIANVNTPNYSRQRPHLETRTGVLAEPRAFSGGVQIAKVIRMHDGFLQKQIFEEAKVYGTLKSTHESLKELESLVHQGTLDVGNRVNEFYNAIRELTVNPEMPNHRFALKEAAEAVTRGFYKLNDGLESARVQVDARLESTLEEVNYLAQDLANLNRGIYSMEVVGEEPGDLYDRRDHVVHQLSQKLGFHAAESDLGHVNMVAPGYGLLVAGGEAKHFEMVRTEPSERDPRGVMDIYLREPSGGKLVRMIVGGELGGLIDVRDTLLTPSINQLDHLAWSFKENINAVHREGTGADGKSGRDIFVGKEGIEGSARYMGVNEEILLNPDALAVGYDEDLPGDNRIALAMADVQHMKIMPSLTTHGIGKEHEYTTNESLNTILANIAHKTRGSTQMYEHQEAVMNQLENYRQSVSGVSMEEEALRLMQFQSAFNASAKMLKVGDDLLQTILDFV